MAYKISRMKTGIQSLDDMIEGGFPFPSAIMVAGAAGTGKTTFALQFLCEGAKNGEQGLYFTTLSEPTQWMLRFTSEYKFIKPDYFGEELQYVDLGAIIKEEPDPNKLLEYMEEQIVEIMPQRIVIDPVTTIGTRLEKTYRLFLYDLTVRLKNWQATTLVTGEVEPGEPYPIEISYIVDGVILLTYEMVNDARMKYVEVLKMRGTNHSTGRHLVGIGEDGFTIQVGLR
jgi:circadian clock protein KaiC